jgi:DNA invertase Pin-like site-specific DNA recombinase
MTANGKPVRAALYLRKSSVDLRAGDNRSLQDQRHDCERLAKAQGFDLVDVFEEEGTSASHMTDHARPMWDKAMDLMGRTYDVLVAWKMNRCTREGMVPMGTLLDHCEATGGRGHRRPENSR